MIEALYQYNDWANSRIFRLADGLSDEQLDAKFEMGFGSLRATLFHMLAAENAWLDRWLRNPWKTFPVDPQGISLANIAAALGQASAARQQIIQAGKADGWSESISYQDSKQNQHSSALADMLMHVANHGVHHRAQALFLLKQFGRKVAGGLDFLFFRIAHPTTQLIPEYVEPMRQYGMEVDLSPGTPTSFSLPLIKDYFSYHDWAIATLVELSGQLSTEQMQHDFSMGVGSIHKTLAHLRDAEKWWLGNWNEASEVFPKYSSDESLAGLRSSWQEIAERRNSFIANLDEASANRVVLANPGRIKITVRVIDSIVQLCCHGTHHRAQIVNMLRQSGVTAPGIDYIVWSRLR
ncbi:MAG: DinB family protein [Pirellulales bacterium]